MDTHACVLRDVLSLLYNRDEMKLYVETSIRLSSHPYLSDERRRNYFVILFDEGALRLRGA
jgi:hypothetical protein